MTSIENLHYAIGELAYAVARADGKVQPEERKKFQSIVESELELGDYDFDVADIIFQIMEKDKQDAETTYKWAMDQIKMNSHYLSPMLKQTFINVMEKMAEAFPPVTVEEQNLIDKFKEEIAPIYGDPVFYESHLKKAELRNIDVPINLE